MLRADAKTVTGNMLTAKKTVLSKTPFAILVAKWAIWSTCASRRNTDGNNRDNHWTQDNCGIRPQPSHLSNYEAKVIALPAVVVDAPSMPFVGMTSTNMMPSTTTTFTRMMHSCILLMDHTGNKLKWLLCAIQWSIMYYLLFMYVFCNFQTIGLE